jgi:hypothetical protein
MSRSIMLNVSCTQILDVITPYPNQPSWVKADCLLGNTQYMSLQPLLDPALYIARPLHDSTTHMGGTDLITVVLFTCFATDCVSFMQCASSP